jgi:ribosome recycling factor
MSVNIVLEETKRKMDRAIEVFRGELSRLKTGRASAAMLADIKADYYGTPTPVNQMATVTVPESRLLLIQPWDASQIPAVEKAILASDIGLTPANDGKVIRIAVPALTEERRKEIAKVARKYAEETRVCIRNLRRDANEEIKKLEKEKKISQDESKKGQEKIQELTDRKIKTVDELLCGKEKEIMEV